MATYSTLGILRVILLTIILLYGPGYVCSRLSGFTRIYSLGVAPPISIALICILSSLPHSTNNELLIFGTVATALFFSRISPELRGNNHSRIPMRHLLFAVISFLLLSNWRWPITRAWTNAIPQSGDSVWHGYLVSMIRDFGLNGPGSTVRVDGALGGSYAYQYGAHTIPGMLAGNGIFGVTTLMNLIMFAAFFIVMPLSGFVLFRLILGRTLPAFLLAISLIFLPNVIDTGFHLFSFGIAAAFLVPTLLMIELHFRNLTLANSIVLAFSLLGLFLTHNSLGLFAILVLIIRGVFFRYNAEVSISLFRNKSLALLSIALGFFFLRSGSAELTFLGFFFVFVLFVLGVKKQKGGYFLSDPRQKKFKSMIGRYGARLKSYLAAVGTPLMLFMLLSVPWVFENNKLVFEQNDGDVLSSRFAQLNTVRKPRFQNFSQFYEMVLNGKSFLSDGYEFPLVLFLLLIFVFFTFRNSRFFLLFSLAILGYSAVATSVDGMWARSWFGGIWLGDAYRAMAIFEICLVAGVAYASRTPSRRDVESRLNAIQKYIPLTRNAVLISLVIVLMVSSFFLLSGTDPRHGFQTYFRNWENDRSAKTVSRVELDGFVEVSNHVPPGSRVLNFFGDGSPWIYPATGVSVVSVWGDGSVSPQDMWPLYGSIEIAVREFDVSDRDVLAANIRYRLEMLSVCALFVGSGNVNPSDSQWVLAMKDPNIGYFFSVVKSGPSDEYTIWVPRGELRPSQCDLGAS